MLHWTALTHIGLSAEKSSMYVMIFIFFQKKMQIVLILEDKHLQLCRFYSKQASLKDQNRSFAKVVMTSYLLYNKKKNNLSNISLSGWRIEEVV